MAYAYASPQPYQQMAYQQPMMQMPQQVYGGYPYQTPYQMPMGMPYQTPMGAWGQPYPPGMEYK